MGLEKSKMKSVVLKYEDGTTISYKGKAARQWSDTMMAALEVYTMVQMRSAMESNALGGKRRPVVDEKGDKLTVLPNLSNVKLPDGEN